MHVHGPLTSPDTDSPSCQTSLPAVCSPEHAQKLWPRWAACRNADPEIFFGEGRGSHSTAQRFCESCPVLDVCLWTALVEEELDQGGYRFGFRGGLSARRRALLHGVVGVGGARPPLRLALRELAAQISPTREGGVMAAAS